MLITCPHCGKLVSDKCKICLHCDTPIQAGNDAPTADTTATPSTSTPTQTYTQPSPASKYGMKWFNFYIYFALWAGAVLNTISAILYLTGNNITGISPESLYKYFPGMKGINIVFGLLLLGLAAFGIVTRFRLAQFKKNAPAFLYAMQIIAVVLEIAYVVAGSGVKSTSSFVELQFNIPSVVISTIVSLIMLFINIAYYRNRAELFIN